MNRTALFFHPAFLEHDTGPGHVECAARLSAAMERLDRSGLLAGLIRREPGPAPVEAICAVHDPAYVAHIEARSARGDPFREDPDTVGSAGTYRAARLACGAAVEAADAVMAGEADNAFCAVRPPGHHAGRDYAKGFCFFNNVAVAARHLQRRHGLGRVCIVDWDLHHGDGTQRAFYDDPTVLYCSLHQHPLYPGTGIRRAAGRGAGEGFNLNLPMAMGSTATDFRRAFEGELAPAVRRFQPEFVLLSAGFDAHAQDPLSGLRLEEEDFAELTGRAMDLAAAHCGGRLVSCLEGGYDLDALAASVEAHVRILCGANGGTKKEGA